MNNTQGSRVIALGSSTYVRGNAAALAWAAALCAALFVFLAPSGAHADVLFESAPAWDYEMQTTTPTAPHLYLGGMYDTSSVELGIWNGPDFTVDASTTIHIWARWNGIYNNIFDVNLAATTNGDPSQGAMPTMQISYMPGGVPGPYRLSVAETPDLKEYTVPTETGAVIYHGEQIWGYLASSWDSYGADHWIGASGAEPFVQICEGDCSSSSSTSDVPDSELSCSQNCFSNVLFIPGIEASRLYGLNPDGSEEKLWEPGMSADAEELKFNTDGTSRRTDIYTRDIIDTAYVPGAGDIYAGFIAAMNTLKSQGTINDWAAAPYDWRYSPEDVLARGTQNGANIFYDTPTAQPYLIQLLRQLAASSKTGKVTIIAHSDGGLIAKALLQELGDDEASTLVDKVILVAVPQVGTPSAIGALLHGYGQGIAVLNAIFKLTDAAAREIGDTLPAPYYFLPSANYFTYVDDPVVTFTGMPDWATRYGEPIHSVDRLIPFLTDGSRMQPDSLDLSDPTSLNATDVAQAETAHQSLDAWTPPSGIQVIQIAGWGIPTTLSGIDYSAATDSDAQVRPTPIFTVDGDGTVVVPSALWIPSSINVHDYWLNLAQYNNYHPLLTMGGTNGFLPLGHGNIFQVPELLQFISDEITGTVQSLSSYKYISTAAPPSSGHRLRFVLPTSLALNIYDRAGDHTGISTTTGDVEEAVPGSSYTTFAENQYIFIDIATAVRVVINSYATTTFTFEMDEVDDNDTVAASTTYADVPATPDTVATLDVDTSLASSSPLEIDEDDDGTPDISLPPGGTVVDQQNASSTPSQSDAPSTPPVVPIDTSASSTESEATSTIADDNASSTSSSESDTVSTSSENSADVATTPINPSPSVPSSANGAPVDSIIPVFSDQSDNASSSHSQKRNPILQKIASSTERTPVKKPISIYSRQGRSSIGTTSSSSNNVVPSKHSAGMTAAAATPLLKVASTTIRARVINLLTDLLKALHHLIRLIMRL